MPAFRLTRLLYALALLLSPLSSLEAQDRGENVAAAKHTPQKKIVVLAQAARPQQQASPFEEVPQTAPQQPASPFEEPPEAQPGQTTSPFDDVQDTPAREVGDFVEEVEFRGNRRTPREGLMARIFTKKGDPYDPGGLRRDFMVLWNSGYFDDLRLEVEDGEQGKIVRFVVVERRVVRTIRYEGNKSATVSDILERFKERKVGLTVESRYDPTKVQRAIAGAPRAAGRARPAVRQS